LLLPVGAAQNPDIDPAMAIAQCIEGKSSCPTPRDATFEAIY
jgi:hypothetical protein